MQPTNFAVVRFKVKESTLTLTHVAERDRPVANPVMVKLSRVE